MNALDSGDSVLGEGGHMENLYTSSQLCYEPKTTLKKKKLSSKTELLAHRVDSPLQIPNF